MTHEPHKYSPFQPIPFRLTIGVTGHRKLKNEKEIREVVQKLLKKIKLKVKGSKRTPVELCILSPLAEGADRLVAVEVLNFDEKAVLKVVLPLLEKEYLEDFETEESKKEFKRLLKNARNPVSLRERLLADDYPDEMIKEARRQAYEDVGQFVVDHCDILIAIWDGEGSRGKGGTAEIVNYAKKNNCPVCIINAEDPGQQSFNINVKVRPILSKIDKWNVLARKQGEKSGNKSEHEDYVNNQFKSLFPENFSNGDILDVKNESILKTNLIPNYTIASLLAKYNQTRYMDMGNVIFWLAFLAVLVVAAGSIFFRNIKWAYLGAFGLELFFLVVIIAIVLYDKYVRHFHKNWIDYRFLAERIRSSFFHFICKVEINQIHIKRRQGKDNLENKWILFVFEEIWNRLPKMARSEKEDFNMLAHYIQSAWLEDQIKYHKKKHNDCNRKYKKLELCGESIFYLALIAAFCHFVLSIHVLDNWLTLAALALPALAATLEGIRSNREYKRLAIRSKKMELSLNDLRKKFRLITPEKLEFLLNRMEQLMLEETEDWLTFMRPAELYKVV